jgi:hypothetical protein
MKVRWNPDEPGRDPLYRKLMSRIKTQGREEAPRRRPESDPAKVVAVVVGGRGLQTAQISTPNALATCPGEGAKGKSRGGGG